MSAGAVFILIVCAMFATLIITVVVAKLREVRNVQRWPSTVGRVTESGVKSHKKKPGDPGYRFGDTEVSNEPQVEYEYQVGSRMYRCGRLTLGERTSGFELEAILARYPVGASVTVYYNRRYRLSQPRCFVGLSNKTWTAVLEEFASMA